jgi:DNA-binding transcriptional LysR family regulator
MKVAELNSFSKAALALDYTQSNITMQIKQLETELNCTLFDRIGKSISLTEQGKKFMEYAITITSSVENAKHSLNNNQTPSGELKIGILESLCITYMPQLIHEFYKKFPKVNTIINIGTFEELSAMLNNNQIDLLWTFDKSIENSSWMKAIEYPNAIKVISSPLLNRFQAQPLSLSFLKDQIFIFTEQNCSYRNYFENLLISEGIPYNIFLEIGNTEIIKKFVASGLCLSVLPEFALETELATHTIETIDITGFQLNMYSQIFYHKNKWITPAIQEFIKHLREYLK